MRSLPVFGLGIFFALAGLGLFAFTLRRATAAAAGNKPLKKSELRELEEQKAVQKTEANKLRIAGAVCVAIGAALMVLS